MQDERRLDARGAVPLGALGGVAPDARAGPGRCASRARRRPRSRPPCPRGADPRCRRRCRSRTASCPRAASCRRPAPRRTTRRRPRAPRRACALRARPAGRSNRPGRAPPARARAAAAGGGAGRDPRAAPAAGTRRRRARLRAPRRRRAARSRSRAAAAARARRARRPCRPRRAAARSCRSPRRPGPTCRPRAPPAPCACRRLRVRRGVRRAPRRARDAAARPAAAGRTARSRSRRRRRPRGPPGLRSAGSPRRAPRRRSAAPRSKRLPISTASSPCTITPAMRWPRSRAARSPAAASSKSSSSTIASTASLPAAPSSSARRRRRPPAAPAPEGVSLTGRTTALRARSSSSSRPELDEPGVDRVELRQQQAVQRLAEPPLGARDELAHARGAGGRALGARRGDAPDAEEVGRRTGREARHGELGRRVADVDARDQHRLFGEPAAHVRAARLAHERGAQRRAACLEPVGELVELERARAAGSQRLVQLEQLLVRERDELGARGAGCRPAADCRPARRSRPAVAGPPG